METPLIARNTVILFDQDLNDQFMNVSRMIANGVRSDIRLNMEDMFPHISLYNTYFPEGSDEELIKVISAHVAELKPFPLRINKKSATARRYIFLDAEVTDSLRTTHESIVEQLNPLRKGMFPASESSPPGITDAMKANLIKTGMLLSGPYFQPHVTVSHLSDVSDCELVLSMIPDNIDIQAMVRQIHLVETGPFGTCKKVLRSFDLQ